jgi:peroxiredoxin family protein
MAEKRAILIVSADEQHLWSALSVAAASAALGKEVSVFFSGYGAACARSDFVAETDKVRAKIGVATIAELFSSSVDLGITFSVCQTGMQMCGIVAESLEPFIVPTGLLAWLVEQSDSMPFVF